jgi:hypothetical protein
MGNNTDRATHDQKKPRAARQKVSLHGVTLEEAQAGLLAAGPMPDKAKQKAQRAERAKARAKQTKQAHDTPADSDTSHK